MKEQRKKKIRLRNKIENNCTFTAIRQGMISVIPLIVVGAIALMLRSLPIPAYQRVLNNIFDGTLVEVLDFVYYGVFEFFAVILAVTTTISYAMAKQKQLNQQINVGDILVLNLIMLASLAGTVGIQFETFDKSSLSNLNTFTALFVSLVSSKMFFAMKKKKLFRFEKKGTINDTVYTGAIEGIVPAVIIIGFFAGLRLVFESVFQVGSIQELLVKAANNLIMSVDNNFGEGLALVLLIHIMWFFGIHGNNVLDPIVEQNFVNVGSVIFNKTFMDTFVIIGGCGSMLCLVIAILIFSKRKNIRNIASLAASTAIFNISEIVAFGLPVILNPVFLAPFLALPIFNYVMSYAAVYLELVPKVANEVEWTTPIILNAYQATGSWRGIALQLVSISVGVLVYKPFVDMFEKQTDKRFKEDVELLIDTLKQDEEDNKISVYTDRQDELGNVARLLAMEIEEALEKRQLFLLYQPQVDANENCIGAEALIRWNHPIAGYIYPPLIIQLANEKGILHKVEEFIIETTCSAIKSIEQVVKSNFKISVNVTNSSLDWDGFEDALDRCIEKYKVDNRKLWIEITERDAVSFSVDKIEKINRIKSKGHKFLIDDFGMGHTSLLYLQTNQFDVLKLDGILTKDILENKRNSKIISSIAYLSKSLDFDIIAEYVGTREQRDELAEIGCYAFQGNLYSMPISLTELIEWMKNHTKVEE